MDNPAKYIDADRGELQNEIAHQSRFGEGAMRDVQALALESGDGTYERVQCESFPLPVMQLDSLVHLT